MGQRAWNGEQLLAEGMSAGVGSAGRLEFE